MPSQSGIYNGSPDLFIDPTNGTYYLYWVRITGSTHEIMARSASTIDGLASASNITVMTSATTLAAPNIMYRASDSKYFLACEVFPSSVWETYCWVSTSPTSGFTPISGNPIVGNGSACYSQYVFDGVMHAYYAKLTGSIWTMEHRTGTATSDYYTLSSGATILTRAWETSAPHTLDVVEWDHDGYKYWGYYCLQNIVGGPVGLVRSNDLNTWTKFSAPVINVPDARWATVKYLNNVLHIFYTKYNGGQAYIVRDQSTDGINFTGPITTVVPAELGYYNGSPDLFIGPDGTYYLYWVRILNSAPRTHYIMARTASSLDGLATAENITVLTSATTLAAPDMMYYDGKYFLICEVQPSVWETYGWVSTTSPVSGFTPIHGNPILGNGSACYSQHIYGNELHTYYAKETGGIGQWNTDLLILRNRYNHIIHLMRANGQPRVEPGILYQPPNKMVIQEM